MNRPKYTTHKSFHKMMTPQTNPSLFKTEEVGPHQYNVHAYSHSMGLDGDVQSATYRYWRNKYKELHPEELIDGAIDSVKYNAWTKTDESNENELLQGEKRVIAKLLFLPIDGAPSIDSDEMWYGPLSTTIYEKVRTFTKPILQSNSDGQATSATNTVNSPASVTV